MTVTDTTRRAGPYAGNDATTEFSFSFKVFAEDEITVIRTSAAGVDTTLVLDTDYSVALNADQGASPGGAVTYPISGTPLATGTTLVIVGNPDYDQPTELPTAGPYSATTLETQLDKIVIQIQQLKETIGRQITGPASDAQGITYTLPTADLRADLALLFDSNGNVTAGALPSVAVSAALIAFITAATIEDAVAALGLSAGNLDIDGITAETSPATGDTVAIYDASAGANRKMTLANLLKVIALLTAETAPGTGDSILLWDTSAGDVRNMTLANLWKLINSFSALTAPATGDVFAIYDASAGDVKKISLADMMLVINQLTADSTPDLAADYVVTYDASAAAAKKVLLSTLGSVQAWVTYDQEGTPSVLASNNVTSVTDNATGFFTVNFTNAFSDANYCAVASVRRPSGAGTNGGSANVDKTVAPTTTACKIATVDSSGSATDQAQNMVAFLR